jgi:hypothetical protein
MSQNNLLTRSQWKEIILKQKSSGLKVGQYCLQNNLKVHQFNYFQSIFFPKKNNNSSFIEVKAITAPIIIPLPPKMTVQYNDINLIFEGDYDNKKIYDLIILLRSRK